MANIVEEDEIAVIGMIAKISEIAKIVGKT